VTFFDSQCRFQTLLLRRGQTFVIECLQQRHKSKHLLINGLCTTLVQSTYCFDHRGTYSASRTIITVDVNRWPCPPGDQ